MIIVTGTKRSGTSMWMQILVNGGFPYIGEAFPKDWGTIIKDANPEGFYESALAGGVWWRTNPSPRTGAWLHPKAVENYAVKVFIRGLARTDYAFITRVVATMREWRQYEASLRRLFSIQAKNRGKEFEEKKVAPLPPGFDWWLENYELVRDIATRRYAVHVLSYGSLLENHEETISKVFDWIGSGDKKKAIEVIKPSLNTQRKKEGAKFKSEFEEVFDELYHRVHTSQPLEQSFIDKMNETHNKIIATIQEVAPGYLRTRERMDAMDPPDEQETPDSQNGESEKDAKQKATQRPARKAPQGRARRAPAQARAAGK